MLPKLQQSSIAQSLRRDNLASQIQCNPHPSQAKISSRILSANKLMTATNHGKTTTPPKTRTPRSEISPRSTSPKKNSKTAPTNPTTNSHFRDRSPSTLVLTATEEKPRAPSKRSSSIKNQSRNPELSRKEKSLLQSSEGTTIEETFPSESTTKTPCPNSYGKSQFNHSTIITIFRFSLMGLVKSLIHTDPLLSWGHMTF